MSPRAILALIVTKSALIAATVQVAAVGGGIAWGWTTRNRGVPAPWASTGILSVLLLLVGQFRDHPSPRRYTRGQLPGTLVLLLPVLLAWEMLPSSLALGAIFLIQMEVFLHVINETFATQVLVLMPFILAINVLVRRRSWLAIAGVALFLATCLAMITSNGLRYSGGTGYFDYWIAGGPVRRATGAARDFAAALACLVAAPPRPGAPSSAPGPRPARHDPRFDRIRVASSG